MHDKEQYLIDLVDFLKEENTELRYSLKQAKSLLSAIIEKIYKVTLENQSDIDENMASILQALQADDIIVQVIAQHEKTAEEVISLLVETSDLLQSQAASSIEANELSQKLEAIKTHRAKMKEAEVRQDSLDKDDIELF